MTAFVDTSALYALFDRDEGALSGFQESRHKAAVEAVLAAGKKKLSLVDCVSFQTMRESASALSSASTTTSANRGSR